MNYLLNTNVVCEATAKHPEATVLAWIEAADFPADVKIFNPWTG